MRLPINNKTLRQFATRQILLGIYMFKVDSNKNVRTRYDTPLKLKPKTKCTRITLLNGALLFYC